MKTMTKTMYLVLLLSILVLLPACQDEAAGLSQEENPGIISLEQPEENTLADSSSGSELNSTDPITYSSFDILGNAEYDVQLRLTLVNHGPGSPSKQNLWVALVGDVYPYQEVLERDVSPGDYALFTDEYGNQIAEFDFSNMPPESEIEVQINYRVKINKLEHDLDDCQGDLPAFFTGPELHIESHNPQIVQLSAELSEGNQNACEQVRAFYDHIGNELVYSYNGGNWGAQAALGEMGADCTEYASLMIALNRAAGIPARYIEGLIYAPEGEQVFTRQEHAWLEVYLPGIGWTPMDPTLGRSSITREQYFAKLPADHIIVTRGRNPSALRGGSYWTYLYWPGNSAEIKIAQGEWSITPLGE
jgi:transglutaminase-like putative cysteine protease